MARGKDLEVDQLQSRVNSCEGEFVSGTLCRNIVWHLCICANYVFVNVNLFDCFVIVNFCVALYMCVYQSIACLCVHGFETLYFITACILDALYEKKQAIMMCEHENEKLQAQVKNLETTSAEKDVLNEAISAEKETLNAKYEAMVKEIEGQIIQ